MPTAYTAPILQKPEFTWLDYLERCVHGFIRHEDENIDSRLPDEIKEFQVYFENDIELLEEEYKHLQTLSHAQRIEKGRAVIRKRVETLLEWHARGTKENERYDEILSKVVQWIPPTEKHEEFKKFAISQIESSKTRVSDYEQEMGYLEKYSPETAFQDHCNNLLQKIEYMRESITKQRTYAETATQWLKKLRESLCK